jgi:hypothetical protein
MKLSIAQIALGTGILIAMALSMAWDPTGFYIRESLGEPGSWRTIFNPDTREVIATILGFLVLLLGSIIIGVSIALLIAKVRSEYTEPNSGVNIRAKKLVVTQMILGLLTTVSSFLVCLWGFPTSYTYPPSNGLVQIVHFTPAPRFVLAQGLSLLTFLMGIVVLGCSIAQIRSFRISKKELNIISPP